MPGWHRVIVTARTTNSCLLFIYLFFSRHFLSPGKGAKYGRLRADSIFFGRPAAWFKHQLKKKALFLLKKHRRNQQKKTKNDRTRLRGRTNITAQTYRYETEEVSYQRPKGADPMLNIQYINLVSGVRSQYPHQQRTVYE